MILKCCFDLISTFHFKRRLTTPAKILVQTTQNNHKNDLFQKPHTSFLQGRIRASLMSFDSSRLKNSHLTHSFFSNALKVSAKMGFLPEGKQLHGLEIKLGYCNVLALQNQILNVYVKCKEFRDARLLFDEMIVRNVVTWNTLICGLAENGRHLKSILYMGLNYFRRMLLEGMSPDYITYSSLIRMSIRLEDIEIGRQLHCCIVKWGLCRDFYVNSALVDFYAKFGFVQEARQVFDNIEERDLVLWNVMVYCYVLNKLGEEAFGLFRLIQLEGIKGDNFTFTSLINSCATLGYCKLGSQIHGLVIRLRFDCDVVVASALIDMYVKNEKIVDARKVFDEMLSKNVISWNAMIVGYGQYGDGKEATNLFMEMQRENFRPDELTLASVLSLCGNLSSNGEIIQFHAYASKAGIIAFLSVANALINAYSKCGSITCACKSFTSIEKPDLVSYTSMIGAYAFHGLPRESIELFEKMLSNGIRPDGIVFLGVLSACSHGGLVSEGLHYLTSMTKNYQIVPDSEHYTCLIDILGRVGLLNEAFTILTSMPTLGVDMLGAFIGACKVHKNVELAKWAAEKLFMLEPKKHVNYILMSNMYASVGSWFDVATVRKMMRENCCCKVPGLSWIEIGGEVQTFVSRDKSHPQSLEVYDQLGLLVKSMKEDVELVACLDF